MTSRFARYKRDDLAPRLKLDQGNEFTKTLIGTREYTGGDNDPVPILDLTEPDTGELCAWMASSWHAIDQLDLVDPQIGDTIRVRRLADKGRSHQYRVEIVGREASPRSGIPSDPATTHAKQPD